MIDVKYGKAADRFLLEAKGHAGAGERGSDVVCAGVSAILYGFLYYLSEKYGSELVWRETGDSLYICFPNDSPEGVSVAIASLRLISDTYPQYVSITERR